MRVLPLLNPSVDVSASFATFWQRYPRKIGKLVAMKAYAKARQTATAEQILAGVELYIRTKPGYADFCHPATFLNQGRWLDEPGNSRDVLPGEWRCWHVPPCHSRQWCQSGARDERDKMRGHA